MMEDTNSETATSRVRFTGRLINESVEFLKGLQNEDGGFPWDQPGTQSGDWVTAGILWALLAAGEAPHYPYMRKALEWLLDMSDGMPDGGIPIAQRPSISAVDATSTLLMVAARTYKQAPDPKLLNAIRRMTRYLISSRCPDGGWAMWSDEDKGMTIDIAYALMGLTAAQDILQEQEIQAIIEDGMHWLWSIKNPEGWGLYKGNLSKAVCTAFSLLALASQRKALEREAIAPDIAYLKNTQKVDGTWPDLIERHKGISFHRFASPYCIWALVASGETLTSTTMQRAFGWLIKSFQEGYVRYEDSDIITWSTRDCLLALSSIHFNLEASQIVDIIDQNFELGRQVLDLQQSVDNLRKQNAELYAEREAYVRKTLDQKIREARSKITLLKLLAVILPLLLIISVAWLVKLALGLTWSDIAVFLGGALAVWAVYAYMIYEIKFR